MTGQEKQKSKKGIKKIMLIKTQFKYFSLFEKKHNFILNLKN